jgi:trk system potassium uptake protein TrkH
MVRRDSPAGRAFVIAIVLAAGIGFLGRFLTRRVVPRFYAKDGFIATGLAWIVMSIIGCLPFFLSGRIPN